MTPDFLGLDDVLDIHDELIAAYGGVYGVRDLALLQSAIAAPEAGSREVYFHEDLFEMAAAYLVHLVRNHPFVDGNKRTGAVSALQFLHLNGVAVTAPDVEFEALILDVSVGRADKARVAEFFRRHRRTPRGRGRS